MTDRLERRAIIVDIVVSHDENLVKFEKENKYLELSHEIVCRMRIR